MTAFAHQVAGHPSSLAHSPTSPSGSSLIKPSTPVEYAFYSQLSHTLTKESLSGVWIPEFWGTLELANKGPHTDTPVVVDVMVELEAPADGVSMLVLENITFPFVRPNVLDVKLGTQLYDEEAAAEKRARMQRVSKKTTSASDGMRISGFKVWNADAADYTTTNKSFGKQLISSQLPLALSHFFPGSRCAISSTSSKSLPAFNCLPLDEDRNLDLNMAQIDDTRLDLGCKVVQPRALPLDLLVPLLQSILYRLGELLELLETMEWRMRSGSVLIVYEGDEDALRSAFERGADDQEKREQGSDGGEIPKEGDGDSSDGDEDGESEEEEEGSTTSSGSPHPNSMRVFDIRLIDFAHTTSGGTGSGVDEGVMMGVERLTLIIQELLDEAERDEQLLEQ